MNFIKSSRARSAIALLPAILISAVACASAEGLTPTTEPEPTATAVQPAEPNVPVVEQTSAYPEQEGLPHADDPRHPSNFTPEQIEAATQRAQCLRDQGIDDEVVAAMARGQIVDITPELIAASNACGMTQTISSEPRTENPINLDLTLEQTVCFYNSLGQEAVTELVAGGQPEVGAYDPFVAFEECGIDISEVLPSAPSE